MGSGSGWGAPQLIAGADEAQAAAPRPGLGRRSSTQASSLRTLSHVPMLQPLKELCAQRCAIVHDVLHSLAMSWPGLPLHLPSRLHSTHCELRSILTC